MKKLFFFLLFFLPGCTIAFEKNPEYQPTLPNAQLEKTIYLKCEERFFRGSSEIGAKFEDSFTNETLTGILPRQFLVKRPNDAQIVLEVDLKAHRRRNFINYVFFEASFGVIPLYSALEYELDALVYDINLKKHWRFHIEQVGYAWNGWISLPLLPFNYVHKTDKNIKRKMLIQLVAEMHHEGIF